MSLTADPKHIKIGGDAMFFVTNSTELQALVSEIDSGATVQVTQESTGEKPRTGWVKCTSAERANQIVSTLNGSKIPQRLVFPHIAAVPQRLQGDPAFQCTFTACIIGQPSPDPTYQIFVKSLSNQTYVFDVTRNTKISDLKAAITEKSGVPKAEMRLIYSGKNIEEQDRDGGSNTIATYNIQKESTLYLLLRLRGGVRKTFFC